MRRLTDVPLLERFMVELGRAAQRPVKIYFTGGATAILHGWRQTTIDLDIKLSPDSDDLLRVVPRLKEKLEINVELAAPDNFIPPLPGWQERSLFICQEGSVGFYHYDPYAQALSKLERGHATDLDDVASMLKDGLIETNELVSLFERIVPELYRYPAIDPVSFRSAVEEFVGSDVKPSSGDSEP
jgi:hypothetical protein